jgi:hypothetical protein
VSLALVGIACGLFETRKPTDPGSNTFPCAPLDQQNNAFNNLRLSFGRGEGLPCYLSGLDDAFAFQADPADIVDMPAGTFDNWTKSVEQQVAQTIAGDASDIVIDYKGNYVLVSSGPDTETRQYTYEIHDYKGTSIPDTLFQGIAEITIHRSSGGLWLITHWVDRRDPAGTTTRTWGYLRGSYRI